MNELENENIIESKKSENLEEEEEIEEEENNKEMKSFTIELLIHTKVMDNREEIKQCIDSSETFKTNVNRSWYGENANQYITKTEQSTERLRQIRNSIIATKDVVKRIAKRTYDSEMAALDISTKRTY